MIKFSLNVNKTEIIISKAKKTIAECLKFQMSGQKIKLNKQVKYLGIRSGAIGLLLDITFLNIYSKLYITLCLTHIWYMLVKYVVKTTIIHFFKEFQDCKKRLFLLFVLLTSRSMIHPAIRSLKKTRS